MGAEAEPVTQAPEEVPTSSSEPINEQAPAEKETEVPAEVTKEAELEDGERRHYQHGDVYVTLDEFRETPMGRDILGDEDEDAAEKRLRAKFGHFTREAEHRALGGHFDLQEMADTEKPWEFMTATEKVESVVVGFTKFFCIWGVLYLFIIALGIMGDAFKILGGRSSGKAFRESELLANPVAGLCIGILATVLMQSSSTTTSIVISMSAADLITVENAAYLVMGANIGTSVTNTIVSIAHLNSKDEYRRAFTGAVYHDMFNWLTVGIFLPLEASSGFLMELASTAVESLGIENETESTSKIEFIKKITKPAAGRVVSTDKKLIEKIAAAETNAEVKKLEKKTIIKQKSGHVLRDTPISDDEAGVLMLFVSLTMLATCLLMLVKLLQSVLKGRVAIWTRYLLNINSSNKCIRSCGGWDNYLLLLFGTGCTILVQSSSVFTSTLTPLVGIGLIHIEKAVALTQGANIGTTVTGVLSALSGSNVRTGMRVALEHVFFNCLGTCLWFCVWPLRVVPLNMAKFMGETAANLKWFPLAYIVGGFLVFPMLIIGLSIPGWAVLCGIMTPIAIVCLGLTVWIFLRRNRADLLPRSSPILRGETAPCGCAYPNFMQLWGGDIDQDTVDLEELREKELSRKAREASSREWPYSAAAWGCAILAFLGATLALPTSQWRRVRYATEGRAEIGFGREQGPVPGDGAARVHAGDDGAVRERAEDVVRVGQRLRRGRHGDDQRGDGVRALVGLLLEAGLQDARVDDALPEPVDVPGQGRPRQQVLRRGGEVPVLPRQEDRHEGRAVHVVCGEEAGHAAAVPEPDVHVAVDEEGVQEPELGPAEAADEHRHHAPVAVRPRVRLLQGPVRGCDDAQLHHDGVVRAACGAVQAADAVQELVDAEPCGRGGHAVRRAGRERPPDARRHGVRCGGDVRGEAGGVSARRVRQRRRIRRR